MEYPRYIIRNTWTFLVLSEHQVTRSRTLHIGLYSDNVIQWHVSINIEPLSLILYDPFFMNTLNTKIQNYDCTTILFGKDITMYIIASNDMEWFFDNYSSGFHCVMYLTRHYWNANMAIQYIKYTAHAYLHFRAFDYVDVAIHMHLIVLTLQYSCIKISQIFFPCGLAIWKCFSWLSLELQNLSLLNILLLGLADVICYGGLAARGHSYCIVRLASTLLLGILSFFLVQ